MTFQKYFTDPSNLEEISYLNSRVYLIDNDIIIWKHLPYMTELSLEVMSKKLLDYNDKIERKYIIVDMTELQERLDKRLRLRSREIVNMLSNVEHMIFIFGKKKMLPILINLVMKISRYPNYAQKNTLEEGISYIQFIKYLKNI
ncbi:MAG: hypothetical protein OEY49_20135 [Candidatus Heimdallarchaeota archaeon]|nr:hypothetical protein [Candidatus Heimdallarchaeota archaeon]